MRFSWEISWFWEHGELSLWTRSSLLHNFLMRFPNEILCLLQSYVRVRFFIWNLILSADEISWFLALIRCPCELLCFFSAQYSCTIYPDEMSYMLLGAVTSFPNKISCFLAVMRCLLRHLFFVHNFRTRYPDEMPTFLRPLRALRMRLHACLALMRFLDEILCFLAAEFSWV